MLVVNAPGSTKPTVRSPNPFDLPTFATSPFDASAPAAAAFAAASATCFDRCAVVERAASGLGSGRERVDHGLVADLGLSAILDRFQSSFKSGYESLGVEKYRRVERFSGALEQCAEYDARSAAARHHQGLAAIAEQFRNRAGVFRRGFVESGKASRHSDAVVAVADVLIGFGEPVLARR